MTEMFKRPGVIDAKTYETPLSVEKGVFRRRQIPAVVEARQLQPDKYATRKWATLGIISRISISDVIRYDLTLQRGGNHKDLRPLQDNERICRADGTSIVDIITRGWNCGKFSPVVYAWYDKGNIEEHNTTYHTDDTESTARWMLCIVRTNTDGTDYQQTAE